MGTYHITIATEKCSGCLRCQLSCSEANTRTFKPFAANIRVEMMDELCVIRFTENCTACGICADNCFYGALTKTAEENNA